MELLDGPEELCPMCNGLHGTHRREKRRIREKVTKETANLLLECKRLEKLHADVCWYEFERMSAKWQTPWHGSIKHLNLRSYYQGTLDDAPSVPVEIVRRELVDAQDCWRRSNENISAAVDWAPGGRKYLEMVRDEHSGAAAYNMMHNLLN